ncbi:MAG: UvrD-helicase domain-containing protein [Deltaproteobacteria bacterium]|nr:UvrD-helicase domain-containing protein [Deltaproteobacteria bacterium]
MQFLIADTFQDSLARLTADEQKAVKITVYDLQANPASPSIQLHRIDKTKDKNFWSARASRDIRLIVHKTDASFLICYVDHHDKAYSWAERRKMEVHPRTGAVQLVEVRERVEEIYVPQYVEQEAPPLFDGVPDDDFLGYGVPEEWLDDVRTVNSDDGLLALVDHLPGEAAEALLELATGGKPEPSPQPIPMDVIVAGAIWSPTFEAVNKALVKKARVANTFVHPDSKRRFRIVESVEELERALEYPWEKWTVFLHPSQREIVEANFQGPARVSGSAGTGKTIVALHRAVFLARKDPEARVLLTTFSEALANALRASLRRLIHNEPKLAERLEVHAIDSVAHRLYRRHIGEIEHPTDELIDGWLSEASEAVGDHKFRLHFLRAEWDQVVDAWQLETWEAYRDVPRLGRKSRLSEAQRVTLWEIFGKVHEKLDSAKLVTKAAMYNRLAQKLWEAKYPPFEYVVVDEAQDIDISQLRFLAAVGGDRPNALFFAGDLGQQIFQQPFSWKSAGVEIRGRSRTLRVNYRTSHQIRQQADRLLDPEIADVDGNVEKRTGTVSVFNGPAPEIRVCESEKDEIEVVSAWLKDRAQDGLAAHEMGIFVRSAAQLGRAQEAIRAAEIPFKILDENLETTTGFASVGTMHFAKGLEFRAVVVMGCDEEVVPLQERIETVTDESDLKVVYESERHLLYVACTRARDRLLVTSSGEPSEFLDDMGYVGSAD